MYIDERLPQQLYQERVQQAEQERLALLALRTARAARRGTARPVGRGRLAGLLRWGRPVATLQGAGTTVS